MLLFAAFAAGMTSALELRLHKHVCLQAMLEFKGCQAILSEKAAEADAAVPTAEEQAKLLEVTSPTDIEWLIPADLFVYAPKCTVDVFLQL